MLTLLITLITSLTHGPIAAVCVFLLSLILEMSLFVVFANTKHGKDAVSAVRDAFAKNEDIEDNHASIVERRATYNEWAAIYTKLANELSRSPTIQELANELGWTENKTEQYLNNLRKERFQVVTSNTKYNTLIISLGLIRDLAHHDAFWAIDDTCVDVKAKSDDIVLIHDLLTNRSPLLVPYLDLSDKLRIFSKTICHASLLISVMDRLVSKFLLNDMSTDKYRAAIEKISRVYRNTEAA